MVHDRGVDLVETGSLGVDERTEALISYRLGDMHAPALPEREALRNVMSEFTGAIIEGRAPLTDARAGVRVLALLEAATRSAANDGAKVAVSTTGGAE
jgi:predicted dehydrogenase